MRYDTCSALSRRRGWCAVVRDAADDLKYPCRASARLAMRRRETKPAGLSRAFFCVRQVRSAERCSVLVGGVVDSACSRATHQESRSYFGQVMRVDVSQAKNGHAGAHEQHASSGDLSARSLPADDSDGKKGHCHRRSGDHTTSIFDAALVTEIAGGDASALGRFYDRWVDAVSAIAFRVISDRTSAESTVEAIFWQAWQSSARYTFESGTPGAWLIAMAHRTSAAHAAELRDGARAMESSERHTTA